MSENIKVDSSSLEDSISTAVGVQAAGQIKLIADANHVDIALAGGIAMHVYGFTRATTDVDMVAAAVLPLERDKELSFGGETYSVSVDGREIAVDVIVRSDELTRIYQVALAHAVETERGLKIITPEWLVVMKHLSARAKDKLDLLWLLQQESLVDREKIKTNLTEAVGEQSAFFIYNDLQGEFDYADFLKVREKNKYGE
jgi:hypothetical protein